MYDRGLVAGVIITTAVALLVLIAMLFYFLHALDEAYILSGEILELAKSTL